MNSVSRSHSKLYNSKIFFTCYSYLIFANFLVINIIFIMFCTKFGILKHLIKENRTSNYYSSIFTNKDIFKYGTVLTIIKFFI